MLDFLKALSDLGSIGRMPWRWWVGILLGLAGMVPILMYVKGEIAVVYLFVEMVLTGVLTGVWQWRADSRAARKHRGKRGT